MIDSDKEDEPNLRNRGAGEKIEDLEMNGLSKDLEEISLEADGLSKLSTVGISSARRDRVNGGGRRRFDTDNLEGRTIRA